MTTRLLSGSTLALAVLAACASPPPAPPAPDAAAIKAALDQEFAKFGPMMANKDPAALAALFTDDGTWILPDASTYTGTAAITAGAKAFFDMVESFSGGAASMDKLIVVNDSEAVTFAHGTVTMKMKGGKKAEAHNNPFVDYWKKGAGGWKIAYEVNADGAVPEKKP
jgi:uncharacterized protein (TIGR02246 family)